MKILLKYTVISILLGVLAVFATAQDRYATISQDKSAITLYNDDASATLKLPQEMLAPFLYADLSGNGYSIAVNSTAFDGVSRIFLADLSTENQFVNGAKMLLGSDTKNQFGGTFSQDGSQLAYFVENGKEFDLYVTELANDSSKKLFTLPAVSTVSFSADKRQILVIRKADAKSSLFVVPTSGGTAVEIRPNSNITQAVFSPASDRIAAAVYNPNTKLYDIEIFPFLGTGGNVVVENITNLKNLIWQGNDIIFLADKIAETTGPIFNYDEKNGALIKVESPKIENPVFLLTKNILIEREGSITAPASRYVIDKEDLQKLDSLQNKSIIFVSPKVSVASSVKGLINVEILTKNNIATVQLQLNNNFLSEGEVVNNSYTYRWNSSNYAKLMPGIVPANYRALKEFPDGNYTLTAIGKDLANRIVAEEKITINVANNLTTRTTLPTTASWLEKAETQDMYNISATSTLIDQPKSELNAEMLVRAMRINRGGYDEEKNPYFLFQTRLVGPNNALPIRYGERGTAVMPETANNVGVHAVKLNGEVELSKSANATINTLALLSLALPKTNNVTQITSKTWSSKMFVIADIFSRETLEVTASNTFEAVEEWENGQIVAVIRSSFSIPANTKLFNSPTTSIPATLGTRAAPKILDKEGKEVLGAPPPIDQRTQAKSISVPTASLGTRFSWIDISTSKILKAQDYIRYSLLNSDAMSTIPGYTPPATGLVPGQGAPGQQQQQAGNRSNINYMVTFSYQLVN